MRRARWQRERPRRWTNDPSRAAYQRRPASPSGLHACYRSAIADPRQYAAEAVLRDGGSIHIRAIRPDDRERLLDHFRSLSARSVYFRFFGAKRRLTNAELDQFTRLDFDR